MICAFPRGVVDHESVFPLRRTIRFDGTSTGRASRCLLKSVDCPSRRHLLPLSVHCGRFALVKLPSTKMHQGNEHALHKIKRKQSAAAAAAGSNTGAFPGESPTCEVGTRNAKGLSRSGSVFVVVAPFLLSLRKDLWSGERAYVCTRILTSPGVVLQCAEMFCLGTKTIGTSATTFRTARQRT